MKKYLLIGACLSIIPVSLIISFFITKASSDFSFLKLDLGKLNYADLLKNAIAFCSLCVSLTSLIITISILRNFDVKKQYYKKQMDIVYELGVEIAKCNINVLFAKADGSSSVINFNLFEFGNNYRFENYTKTYITSKSTEMLFPFLVKHYIDPLLPRDISNCLVNFLPPLRKMHCLTKPELDIHIPYIVVRPYNDTLNFTEDELFYEFITPTEFSENASKLKKTIESWFNKFGATDLNTSPLTPFNKLFPDR